MSSTSSTTPAVSKTIPLPGTVGLRFSEPTLHRIESSSTTLTLRTSRSPSQCSLLNSTGINWRKASALKMAMAVCRCSVVLFVYVNADDTAASLFFQILATVPPPNEINRWMEAGLGSGLRPLLHSVMVSYFQGWPVQSVRGESSA